MPLAPEVVGNHYTLLVLPFAQLIEPFEERSKYVREAVTLASRHLDDDRRIVIEMVLLREDGKLSKVRDEALVALGGSATTEGRAVADTEAEIFLALAEILVSEEFADEFAEHVLPSGRQQLPPHQAGITFLSRCFALDLADAPEAVVAHQALRFYVAGSEQRTLGVGYFSTGTPKPDSVVVLTEAQGHRYLDSLPDLVDGKPDASWMHFFHLGHVRAHGEEGTIMWREHYRDTEGTMRTYLTAVARPGQHDLSLAVRLPERHQEHPGRVNVVFDPYGPQRKVLEEWTVAPDQHGWVIQPFTNLVPRLQYGIVFPGLDLYEQ